MPYLKIRLNRDIPSKQRIEFVQSVSKMIAKALSKPESYVMVDLETSPAMIFAGTADPAAYLELKSIGLSDSLIPALSRHLCAALEEELHIEPNRVYIEFADIKAMHWGWNGRTF